VTYKHSIDPASSKDGVQTTDDNVKCYTQTHTYKYTLYTVVYKTSPFYFQITPAKPTEIITGINIHDDICKHTVMLLMSLQHLAKLVRQNTTYYTNANCSRSW